MKISNSVKMKRLLNALNWIYEKKPISDHQPDTYKVKLKSKFSAAIAIYTSYKSSDLVKKRRATSFADDDQNDMQYVLWDKIMCVGSDLMQNKGNKVSERVFFFSFSIRSPLISFNVVRWRYVVELLLLHGMQTVCKQFLLHIFLLIAVFQSMRRTLLKWTKYLV